MQTVARWLGATMLLVWVMVTGWRIRLLISGSGPFQAYLRASGGSAGSGLVRFRWIRRLARLWVTCR